MKRIATSLLVVALVVPGCSWTFSRPPSARPPASCSTSNVAPGFDVYFAVGYAAAGLAMVSIDVDSEGLGSAIAMLSAGLGTLHAISASYGFRSARTCREARRSIAGPVLVPVEHEPTVEVDAGQGVEVEIEEEVRTLTRIRMRAVGREQPARDER